VPTPMTFANYSTTAVRSSSSANICRVERRSAKASSARFTSDSSKEYAAAGPSLANGTVQNFVANSKTGAIVYTPPPAADVTALMRELVEWLRDEQGIHPVLMAGVAQFRLVHTHPFVDGNGRTSRLLSTLCRYRAGYDFKRLFTISEYYDRDRAAFYAALQRVREAGMDLTGWLEFFIAGLSTQLQEVKAKGEQAIRANVIAAAKKLNGRQTSLVTAFLERASLSLADCEKLFPDVARRTLQRDLKRLADAGHSRRRRRRTDRSDSALRMAGGRAVTRSCDKL